MRGTNDKKFDKEYDEEEEEDMKCPPNRHVSRWNPNEGHKRGGATLVYKEERGDAKCPPQAVPWSKEDEESADHEPGKRQTHTHGRLRHEYLNQPSMESSNHQKELQEFAQKDEETIKMEEGVFCAEWEKINEATDGHVPGYDPNERGSSNGRHAVSSSKRPGPGPDTCPGAKAVDNRAPPPNNAHRHTCTLPPTHPGAERVPGPDNEGLDEDEESMTIVSLEESIIPIVPKAECVNPEEDRQAAIHDFIATAPVADVVPDNKGRRQKLVGAFLLVIMIAIVVGAVLGSRTDDEQTMSPSDYDALLSNDSSDGGEALRNSSTPQNEAFNWIVNNNTHLAVLSNEQIIQRYALATIFFSTDGNSWNDNTGWLSELDECSWYGVECTTCTLSDAVSELDLRGQYNDKFGAYEGNNLIGMLPPEIGMLSELEALSFWNNALEGTIPSELWQLTKLKELGLSYNKFEGTIPSEVGQLTKLNVLRLNFNELNGTIPTKIGELTNLTYLSLGNNSLTGAIPSVIGFLTNLEELRLYRNELSGTLLTEMGNLTKLTTLALENNDLTGTIFPTGLGLLTELRELELDNNHLIGTIPPSIGTFTHLDFMDFGHNNITGKIPTELGLLTNLTYLVLGKNGFTGTIPSELGLLTMLTHLGLFSNKLNGTVPTTLNKLTLLTYLYLDDNDLSGSLLGFLCGNEFEQFAANTCGQTEIECDCCTHCCDLQENCNKLQV